MPEWKVTSSPRNDLPAFTLAEGATHVALLDKCRKNAFTLAEVLITLGIIGVVAAMTLPSLIQNKTEKDTVVRLKKSYSVIENAFRLAVNEHGEIQNWGWAMSTDSNASTVSADILSKIIPYLKVSKKCLNQEGCFIKNNYYKFLSGENHMQYSPNEYGKSATILADGTILILRTYSPDRYALGYIYVDINGNKSPNTYGKDMFQFIITKNGLEPTGNVNGYIHTLNHCSLKGSDSSNSGGCTAWVLYKENMDYLHKQVCWDGYQNGVNCSVFN